MVKTNLNQPVPGIPSGPMVDPKGVPSLPWYKFFINLWTRTGGATGSVSDILDGITDVVGSIVYRASSAWLGLAPGARYKVLRMGASVPEWDLLDGNSFGAQAPAEFFASPTGSTDIPSFRALATADFGAQTSNTFLAAPSGAAGAPTFRAVTLTDLTPIIGAAPSDAQILIGQSGGSSYSPKTMSGDATITDGGVVTVTKTGGTAFGPIATLGIGTGLASSGGNLIATGGSGGGTVGSGTPGQLAIYPASGTTVAGTSVTNHAVVVGGGTSAPNSVLLGDAQILVGQTSADPQAKTVGGDATLADTGALTVTKTGGTAFGALATLGVGNGLVSSSGNANVTFANPTSPIGLFVVNGSATTAMRSDAASPIDVSIGPTWTNTHVFNNAIQSAIFNGLLSCGSLSATGNLIVQTATGSSPAARIANTNGVSGDLGAEIRVGSTSPGDSSTVIKFTDYTGLTAVGSITRTGTNNVAYNTSSDIRLKDLIGNSEIGLALLRRIRVADYCWKADLSGKVEQGFIAQELHEVYPAAVRVGGDDPRTEPWGVDRAALMPLVVRALQQIDERLAAIEGRHGQS